jgi:hypothetical protein
MIVPRKPSTGPRRREGGVLRRVGRWVLPAIIASLAGLAVGPLAVAGAEGLSLPITTPLTGTVTNNPTPSFSGTTPEVGFGVTLYIFRDTSFKEREQELTASSVPGSESWEVTAKPLVDGTYTALAIEPGAPTPNPPVTFTIDTIPPRVTLTSPTNGSSTSSGSVEVGGEAGTAPGDLPTVTLQLFAGATPLKEETLQASNGRWSTTLGGLGPGTYSVRAEQSDDAGNIGVSPSTTFTVFSPPPPSPPLASFSWIPAAPNTGENVALVSSSTDTISPITALAWALAGNGAFQVGKPVVTTSFATPGAHVVQLRVTAGDGLASTAIETIHVSSAPLVLMQPFPVVRIAGSETGSGVSLRLLTAQAPPGARITVTCKGRGCPTRSESRVAVASRRRGGATVVEFRRFERRLAAGVVLEIRIFKSGEIGKFTRFVVRHGKLPERGDSCLGPAGGKPIVCPAP